MAVIVQQVVGQLELIEGDDLLHPLRPFGWRVRVVVHPAGRGGVGLAGHEPGGAVEGIPGGGGGAVSRSSEPRGPPGSRPQPPARRTAGSDAALIAGGETASDGGGSAVRDGATRGRCVAQGGRSSQRRGNGSAVSREPSRGCGFSSGCGALPPCFVLSKSAFNSNG